MEKLHRVKQNPVVIMAGGKGLRLRPLTKYCPKPMVKVAGQPIIERIIRRLVNQGFVNIYISVNYLGKVIEDYFKNGQKFKCNIKYIKEKKYLHTGGSLSLIKEKIDEPLIVMNGDLVTKIDFNHFVNFHQSGKFIATVGVKPYINEIPFGVVREQGNIMASLEEKPKAEYLINTGIYILNPEALTLIPKNQVFPLTKLFEKLLKHGKKVGVYKIKEGWIDVGRIEELEKAHEELVRLEEKYLKNSESAKG